MWTWGMKEQNETGNASIHVTVDSGRGFVVHGLYSRLSGDMGNTLKTGCQTTYRILYILGYNLFVVSQESVMLA